MRTAFLLLLLVVASPALAQQPAASWRPWFVGSIDYDYGFSRLVEVSFTDGTTQTLSANKGAVVFLGVMLPNDAARRFETQLQLGWKFDSVEAGNGRVRWRAFPIELTEFYRVAMVRAGAGLLVQLAPSIRGEGVLAGELDFRTAFGAVLQVEWLFSSLDSPDQQATPGPDISLGLRYNLVRYTAAGIEPITSHAVGVSLSFIL